MKREEYQRLKALVQSRCEPGRLYSDDEMRLLIYRTLAEEQKSRYLEVRERTEIGKRIFNALRGLDVLQPLMEDEGVTDIMVNGPDCVFYEKDGQMRALDEGFESRERLEEVIHQIVGAVNRSVNEASPIVDARLADGSRINAVFPPVALNGPVLTIRRFRDRSFTMEELIGCGSLSREAAGFLQEAVRERANLFVCGGTSSGKTTLLNVLSGFIPADERVVTIEDTAELDMSGCRNLVTLEARKDSNGSAGSVPIRELIRAALRMRPDRIIVGEIRGPEALDMLQAMNTGHDGSLSTGHGNSCREMTARMETMVLEGASLPLEAIRAQIASAIDLMVFVRRTRSGRRLVEEIAELRSLPVGGEIVMSTLFERRDGLLVRTEAPYTRRREAL